MGVEGEGGDAEGEDEGEGAWLLSLWEGGTALIAGLSCCSSLLSLTLCALSSQIRQRVRSTDSETLVQAMSLLPKDRYDPLPSPNFNRSHTTSPPPPSPRTPLTRAGQCNNGLTCPYIHDSAKVAICPLFLRHSCPHRPSSCLLSHTPNDHRSPHCTHFPNCKNGISCTYSHVHVARDAGVCEEFARYGWCEKGEKCEQRHAFECPEFSERGTCGTLGCKLPHVLRRRNGEGVVEESSDEEDEVERVVVEKEVRRKRRAEEGISGEAGRRLKVAKGLAANEDFVTLFVPLSDEEADDSEEEDDEDDVDEEDEEGVVSDEEDEEGVASDEDDDGMSVESADLEGLQDDDDDELLVGFVDGTERAEGDSHRRPEFVDAEVEDTEVEQLLRS